MSFLMETLELSRMARRLVGPNVLSGEHVVVVTSTDQHQSVVEAIGVACDQIAATTTIVVLPPPSSDVTYRHPASAVCAAQSADVVIVATSLAFPRAYDDLTAAVLKAGARIVLLNNASPADLSRGAATADPVALNAATVSIAAAISKAGVVRVCAPDGTDLQVNVARPCYALTGIADSESGFGSFPSGEAMLAVGEGTAHGTFVATDFGQAVYLDGMGPPLGLLEDNISLEFVDGKVRHISGGSAARRLLKTLESGDADSSLLGELGIGTNPHALAVNAVENKFRLGTAHIALGANDMIGWRSSRTYGGTIKSGLHIDLVAREAQIFTDGRLILDCGRYINSEIGNGL